MFPRVQVRLTDSDFMKKQDVCKEKASFVKDDEFVPNFYTKQAMLEAEKIAADPNVKGYTDLEELFRNLKS